MAEQKWYILNTPIVNFINILGINFLYKSAFFAKILLPKPKYK